ncbi:MAG TPA: hypothetical protein VG125_00500 [Pirellulales bacterium]|jgi:uncharacterized protein (DUF1697 family)|nr:hypothetical protein [Pirellulales bacterium]
MAMIVLLRGANVGGRRFSPKAVEAALADLEVVNVGAAGTFVVRKRVAEKVLRARIEAELPFSPAPMIVVKDRELVSALRAGGSIGGPPDAKRFATAMESAPGAAPELPIEAPSAANWGVRVVAISGRFALGVRRRVDVTGVYPNEVVERAFGVAATTRDWPTMEKLAKLLAI